MAKQGEGIAENKNCQNWEKLPKGIPAEVWANSLSSSFSITQISLRAVIREHKSSILKMQSQQDWW